MINNNLNNSKDEDGNFLEDTSNLSGGDFAFIQNANGDIKAGGYNLETAFAGKGAMISGKKTQSGGNTPISSTLKDLAVPAGLFYLQQNFKNISKPYESAKQINKKSQQGKSSIGKNNKSSYDTDFVISENMFDKLLAMVEPQERKIVDIKTRKRRGSKQKKTRKNLKTGKIKTDKVKK